MIRKTRVLPTLLAIAAVVFACAGALLPLQAYATGDAASYQIYPTPHSVEYADGSQTLRGTASVLVEDGIDDDTVSRLNEALALKDIKAKNVDEVPSKRGVTSVLVGVKGSGAAVDTYVDQLVADGKLSYTDGLFDHNDAYVLASLPSDGKTPDQVIVLGKTTDAAYYGLTTLYQILQQTSDAKLSAFAISDYADVVTRGFIEGYYGNPWSTQDRVNLMTWGGYYKLNAYVYAPKDDPKHNAQWRSLYTEDELVEKIEPLAKAGNESKCRFVFALHPFMSNPITSSNYDESVAILKEKFTQVMDHGVRQIAILADDAANQGDDLYIKLCKEMTDWLHEKQAEKNADGSSKYEGLKDTLIFCPVAYYGQGEAWYAQMPDNVQVINTGGRIWGKVDNDFVTRFTNNSGVAPFMWINWPCTDNTKDSLSMGGYENALGTDVTPGSVEGVVLNPMQQSEPSKAGIFMNADFSWNMWTNLEHADQTWEDSFSYIDHNSPVATKGSNALRELSRHMKRYTGQGVVYGSRESENIREQLQAFQAKINAGNVTEADCDQMIDTIKVIQKAAKDYRSGAGNKSMFDQIVYWIDMWDDYTRGIIAELEALKADIAGNSSQVLTKYAEGSSSIAASQKHGFHYVDHTEYAAGGKLHIMPMVNALDSYLAQRAEIITNPNADLTTFVTSRTDAPEGSTENVFDGNVNTGAIYKNPATLEAGTYFGMTKTKAFDLNDVTFVQGGGKDFMDHAKLQTYDGETWTDVEGAEVKDGSTVTWDGLALKGIYGVRIIAAEDNARDAWPTINEIVVNKADEPETNVITGTVSMENQVLAGNTLQNASDGNADTEAWFKKANGSDFTDADATVTVTFGEVKTIGSIVFAQGTSAAGDVISSGKAYYQTADDQWHEAGDVTSATSQTFALDTPVQAKAIKVVNNARADVWWRVADLHAVAPVVEEEYGTFTGEVSIENQVVAPGGGALTNASDGNSQTVTMFRQNNSGDTSQEYTIVGASVIVTFDGTKTIGSIVFEQGGDSNDVITSGTVSYQDVGGNWHEAGTVNGDKVQTFTLENEVAAKAIKVVNNAQTAGWWRVYELNAVREEPETPVANENILTNVKNNSLTATVEDGHASLSAGTVAFGSQEYLAIDLGAVRKGVTVDAEVAGAGAERVYSQNGLEWNGVPSDGPAFAARYVGVKTPDSVGNVVFTRFDVTFASIKPASLVTDASNLGSFNAGTIFDGDVTTSDKPSGSNQNEGAVAVFDLGQERTINSIAYYTPEGTLDFIRKGVIEVADSPDAPDSEWTTVLQINKQDAEVENVFNSDTAKSGAPWLTHDSSNPGYVYTANPKTTATAGNENDPNGSEQLNVTGRYLRVRITGTYSHRWTEISEIQINGGEYVSTYGDADFTSTVTEVPGMSPANLNDGDTTTAWQPNGPNGTLSYQVSNPIAESGKAYSGVRIVSAGTPSNATVKATVYTDPGYQQTAEVELGTLSQPISEFTFGELAAARNVSFAAVKNITIAWGDAIPQISEIFLMEGVKPADKTALQVLVTELAGTDATGWTASTAAAFNTALADAQAALDNGNISQTTVDAIAATLQSAFDNHVAKYVGDGLPAKVDNASGDYTAGSYQAYLDAYTAAEQAFATPDELSQADGEALLAAVKDAQGKLAYDQSARQRAEITLEEIKLIYGEAEDAADAYTTDSAAAYRDAMTKLEALVADKGAVPSEVKAVASELEDAAAKLVDARELIAARAAFKAADAKLYTAESFAAYQAAYDASEIALKNGTAEDVADAVAKLAEAYAGLTVRPAVDLDQVIADAEALSKDDYTAASWKTLKAAIDDAKASKGQGRDEALAQAITDAKAALVDVRDLKADLKKAQAIESADYTEDSAAKLNDAVKAAESALENGTAEQVTAARAGINDALEALVNVSALKDAIAKAEKADTSQATDEQKVQLESAITNAKTLLKNGTKDEIAAAIDTLAAAMGNLDGSSEEKPGPGDEEKPGTGDEEKPGTGDGDDNQKPDDTNKPGTGDNQKPGDKGDGNKKPSKPSGNKGTGSQSGNRLPSTGDFAAASALIAGGSGLACLAGAYLTGRRRRR